MRAIPLCRTVVWLGLLGACGCGGGGPAADPPAASPGPTPQAAALPDLTPPDDSAAPPPTDLPKQPPRNSLGDLLEGEEIDDLFPGAAAGDFGPFQPPEIDEQRALASGIRNVAGTHLTLYTDLPPQPSVDELPAVFDLAVPVWCDYFQVDVQRTGSWRMVAYLVNDKERFRRAGLLPDDLPPFLHGFQRGAELWLYEQPTEYYRRHLLLHEGTHGFMQWSLGGAGPPWYMEGTAELLATHRWQDGRLSLRHFPADKTETPHWGRIKVIKDDTAANQAKSLEQIMQYDETAHLEVEPYAWCWAAAAFLDNHPRYRDAFRQLRQHARDRTFAFSNRFHAELQDEWPQLTREWQNFVLHMEYGYDLAREAIQQRPVVELPPEGASVVIAADRGWQSSGYRLEVGRKYRFEAAGRYQVADAPGPWWCEPNGVTIRYYRGLPLGILLGTVVDEQQPVSGVTRFASPDTLGLGGETTVDRSGTLYLRINESPAELADNAGELTIRVTPL